MCIYICIYYDDRLQEFLVVMLTKIGDLVVGSGIASAATSIVQQLRSERTAAATRTSSVMPRGSKYPIFQASSSNNHTLNGFRDQRP